MSTRRFHDDMADRPATSPRGQDPAQQRVAEGDGAPGGVPRQPRVTARSRSSRNGPMPRTLAQVMSEANDMVVRAI